MYGCTTYEISKSPEQISKSLKISQLKTQLIQLEEDNKAYNELLQKYHELQNEYQLMNNAKLHLEYELKQKTENNNKTLHDLKCQNIELTNELEEKNSIYEKLYQDNTNLLNDLDKRKKENENFCKSVMDNDKAINILSEEKSQYEKDAYELDNTAKKNIELNNNQKILNDLKSTNENLNSQINLKNSSLDTVQNQLNIANKSILDLQNEINNLEQTYHLGKDQLQKLQIDFQNEHTKRLQAEDDNVKLESILKDRDDAIQKLTCVNESLKSDRDKLINGKNKLMADVELYKNHILTLTEQTEKLTNELERIISEDNELYNINNNQIQRLQKVICENKKLLQDEIEALNALENYVKCQFIMNNDIQGSKKVGSPNRQTYSRQGEC